MRKKVVMIFLAFLIAFSSTYTLTQQTQEAEAAVLSKLAGKVLKKLTKEVVQDSAVNMATNYAVQEANDILNEYAKKQGYTLTKVGSKPYYVKSELTELDKQAIVYEAEKIIEADSLPGGKNAQKWAKLFDWFIPIFSVGVVVNMLDYTINDGELTAWFNDIAKRVLIKLGFLTPAVPLAGGAPEGADPEFTEKDTTIKEKYTPKSTIMRQDFIPEGTGKTFTFQFRDSPYSNGQTNKIVMDMKYTDPTAMTNTNWSISTGYRSGGMSYNSYILYNTSVPSIGTDWGLGGTQPVSVSLNGNVVSTSYEKTYYLDRYGFQPNASVGRVIVETVGATAIATLYYNNGDIAVFERYLPTSVDKENALRFSFNAGSTDINTTVVYVPDGQTFTPTPFVPQEVPMTETIEAEPIDHSNYRTTTGVVIPPPETIQYKDADGTPLIAKPDPDGDTIFTRPDGTPVPEDDVIPHDPDITKNPDKSITYTPNPSESNPNPKEVTVPIPNATPNPGEEPTPGTDPEPGDDGTPGTDEEIPPGPSCEKDLDPPRFDVLADTFTHAFPFSLPFDLKRAFDALFKNVGDEKPSFKFSYGWAGERHEIDIPIPAMFDKWKPFTDSLLLFTFDILVFLAMIRLIRGVNN